MNDILYYSKIEAGKMGIAPAMVNVGAVVTHAARIFREKIASGGLNFKSTLGNRSDPRVETRVVREKKAGLVAYKGLRCDSEWILPLVCHA